MTGPNRPNALGVGRNHGKNKNLQRHSSSKVDTGDYCTKDRAVLVSDRKVVGNFTTEVTGCGTLVRKDARGIYCLGGLSLVMNLLKILAVPISSAANVGPAHANGQMSAPYCTNSTQTNDLTRASAAAT